MKLQGGPPCKSFQTAKRGEICRIPGCSVATAAPGTATPIRLPNFQGDTFKQFISYVYTGKIMHQDNGLFEMLTIAQELGVEELRVACEEHFNSTLSVSNACTYLTSAMEIQDRAAGLDDRHSLHGPSHFVIRVDENI
ncbi:hypothetical protein M8J77_004333 [Diaphorina citri]|nr:hypothetical protein M8J77_004333 [Diaphorina citri]